MPRALANAAFGTFLLLACGACGAFVPVGSGEEVDHIASFDEATAERLRGEVGFAEPAVGLKYEYYSLFFLNVWTWEGDIVIYENGGDDYVEVTPNELHELTGRSADEFGKPFLYHFPFGQLLILGAIAAFAFKTWRSWKEVGITPPSITEP